MIINRLISTEIQQVLYMTRNRRRRHNNWGQTRE